MTSTHCQALKKLIYSLGSLAMCEATTTFVFTLRPYGSLMSEHWVGKCVKSDRFNI